MKTKTMDEKTQESVKIIKRQTDYSEEKIIDLLNKFDGNVEKVIMDYHGIDLDKKKREKEAKLTTNQKIFRKIGDYF